MIIPILDPNIRIKSPSIILIQRPECSFCRQFKPIFEALSNDPTMKFYNFRTYDYNMGVPKFTSTIIKTVPHIIFSNGSKEMKYEGQRDPELIKKSFQLWYK